jgi:hypothetical protein
VPTRLCDLQRQVHRDNSPLDGPGRNNVGAYYLRLFNHREEGNSALDVRSYRRALADRECGQRKPRSLSDP